MKKLRDQITQRIEYFRPESKVYDEITLIDCNDSFTHNLVQSFLKLGAPVRVFRSHQITVEEVESLVGGYLVISPGPGDPQSSGTAPAVYKKLKGSLPVLGVCLGMQIINEEHGGQTITAPVPVHGKVSKISHNERGIFRGVKNPTVVARYHSLHIDPGEVEIQSESEGTVMAFRKEKVTAAVQFHPESFLTADGMTMMRNFLEGSI